MYATLSIPHPNGTVESITSDDIERLYAMTVAEYVAFVAKEPIDDGGRMLRERRALVESGAVGQKSKPKKHRGHSNKQQTSQKRHNSTASQSNAGKPRKELRKVSKAQTASVNKKQASQPRKKQTVAKAKPKKASSTRPAHSLASKPREIGPESIGPMGLPRLCDMTPSYRTTSRKYNHTPMGPELTEKERKQR